MDQWELYRRIAGLEETFKNCRFMSEGEGTVHGSFATGVAINREARPLVEELIVTPPADFLMRFTLQVSGSAFIPDESGEPVLYEFFSDEVAVEAMTGTPVTISCFGTTLGPATGTSSGTVTLTVNPALWLSGGTWWSTLSGSASGEVAGTDPSTGIPYDYTISGPIDTGTSGAIGTGIFSLRKNASSANEFAILPLTMSDPVWQDFILVLDTQVVP